MILLESCCFFSPIVCLNLIPCFCFDVMKSQTAYEMEKLTIALDVEIVNFKISA